MHCNNCGMPAWFSTYRPLWFCGGSSDLVLRRLEWSSDPWLRPPSLTRWEPQLTGYSLGGKTTTAAHIRHAGDHPVSPLFIPLFAIAWWINFVCFFSYVFKTKMPYSCPSFNKRFLMWACLLQVHAVCFLSYTLKYWLLVAFAWWAISWLLAQIDEQDETHTVFLFMVTHLYHF